MIAIPREPSRDDVYEELAEANPTAMVADGFEDAYIGHTIGIGPSLAVYDYQKCVEVLMEREGLSELESIEYLDHNTVYAYVGEGTPLFIHPAKSR